MSVLLSRPTYCNVCRHLLLSVIGKPGRVCYGATSFSQLFFFRNCECSLVPARLIFAYLVCGYTTHSDCTAKAPLNCVQWQGIETDGDETKMAHHWIQGNLHDGVCMECKQSVSIGSGLSSSRCYWCTGVIHNTCEREGQFCDFGPFKDLILPPYALSMAEDVPFKLDAQRISAANPLAVFINKRSGGLQGDDVIQQLSSLINPLQIFDLAKGGPKPGLDAFKPLIDAGKSFYILGCGGDGTIGWICAILDKTGIPTEHLPPIAVLPLGTGNDMARSLGWGGGYSGESLARILAQLENSVPVLCDRWNVIVTPLSETDKGEDVTPKKQMEIEKEKENKEEREEEVEKVPEVLPAAVPIVAEDPVKNFISNNYFSLGIDAKCALDFHLARQANPANFNSRTKNKMYYAGFGASAIFDDTCKALNEKVRLEVDGQAVDFPKSIEGISILNLPSYAGGTDLWRKPKKHFKESSISDRLVEVVGFKGSIHIGQIKTGTARAKRLAQGHSVRIVMLTALPVQVDGEPWLQDPCVIEVKHHNQVRMLQNLSGKGPHHQPEQEQPEQQSASSGEAP
eukprot:TRINITY_DN2671_c0_g1_i5.p1 TRINITY_DN2671_c0_g1~~TRINITY_DN2671_c0_g1_i5.p1  ORF type:complete len:631 (+),score=69.24 TRINITY_DN2671_c0_g1_i5:189-1895(+)